MRPSVESLKGAAWALVTLLLINFGLFLGTCSREQDVESLIKRLNHKKEEVRWEAAFALGKMKDSRAVRPLITTMKTDKESRVRRIAAWALGETGDLRATKPLLDGALKDGMVTTAAEALAKIDDPRAVKALVDALKLKIPVVRYRAAGVLGEIGDPGAIEPLCVVFMKDKDSAVRNAAGKALAKIGESVDDALIDTLTKDLEFVAATYPFFIARGDIWTQPVLIEALDKFGGQKMAEDFLNCGNLSLANAAERWAERHGYNIAKSPGAPAYTWGSKKRKGPQEKR